MVGSCRNPGGPPSTWQRREEGHLRRDAREERSRERSHWDGTTYVYKRQERFEDERQGAQEPQPPPERWESTTRSTRYHPENSMDAWSSRGKGPNLTPREVQGQGVAPGESNWDSVQRELRTSLENKRAEHAKRIE